MASQKEISSTEKLLEIIRSNKTAGELNKVSHSHSSPGNNKPSFFKNMLAKQAAVSVGLDVGYRYLRLIKVTRAHDGQWKLVDHHSAALRSDAPKGTPQFADFLKLELDKFCRSTKRFNLWANMSSANVEVASLRVPKVGRKQLENVVLWSAKKSLSFNERESVFDFEIEDEVVESGVTKLVATVYTAPRKEVQETQDLFEEIGYPLDGLTIAPFGIQNLFNTDWIPSLDATIATLYIGRSWSRIDIFSKGRLAMTRGIRAGINSMIEELIESHNEGLKRERQIEHISGADGITENLSMKLEEARELIYGLSPDSPSTEELRSRFGLTEESIFRMINPALDRLVRQIDRTFRHYTVTLGNERVTSIYVSSATNVYRPLIDYISEDLGIEGDVLDPLDPQIPPVNETTTGISISDRVSFGIALGVALSDASRTPNLLFTYKDKAKEMNVAMGTRAIFVGLAVILVLSVAFLFVLQAGVDKKEALLADLENQLKQGVQVDENVIPLFVSKVQKDRNHIRLYSKRYLGLATISELTRLTPSNIRLMGFTAHMTGPANNDQKRKGYVTIEGVVSGDINTLEDSLVEYVLKLQSSPMFSQAKISKSTIETFERTEILRFTLNVKYV